MLDLSSVIERAVADELAAWESGQVPEDARSPEERPGHWQRIDLSIMDEIGRPFTGIANLYRKLLGKMEHEPEVAPDLLPPESAVDRYMGGEWLPVISSNVAAIRYLPEENALEVEYHGGREHIAFYRYNDIGEGEARDFAESPSKGKWVWNVLRLRGTVYGYQKPYVFLDAPSSYSPKWMESEETRAAHGAIGPDGRSALLSREWDETKIKRDEAGKFAEQNRARFHAIESGDLGHVQGFPVRRLGDKTWRIDTPGGYVEGGHEDVQAHIDQIKTHEASLKPMVDGALARADAFPEYNPFADPGKAEAEGKAFEAIPHGAMVVSLDPMTRGRVGEIVKVSEPGPDGSHRRVTRVKLNGVLGWGSNDIEPLDSAHSWRVDRPAKPAVPKMTQGVLFARRSYSGPGLFDGPHWTAYDGPHGGKGWKSTLTGQVRYQVEMPGEHEHEGPVQASEPAAPEPAMETPAGGVSAWSMPEPAAVAPVAESAAEPTPPVAELAKAKEPAKSDDKETAWSHSVTDYEKGRLIPAEMYDGLVPRGVEGFTLRVKKKPNGNYDVWTETRAGSKNPYATDKDADLARHAAWRAYNMGNPTQHASDFAVVINNHKKAVKAALAAGKPVPPEVLADYPDLAGPAKAAEAEPTPPAGEEPAPNAPPASPKKSLVEDFGEKIGGARKEVAKPLGARVKKADTGESERPAWARRYGISQIASSNNPAEVGKWSIRDAKDTDWHGQAKQKGKLFDTKEEAEQAVPLLAVARNHRVYAVSGAQVAGDQQFGIYRNITDRKRALIKDGFASENDAMKYMAANPEEIIEHKFPRYETYAYLDHVERKGPEHKTTDVAPADFQKTFQFRGGEFGNWQSGRDGVESLNHAYDALHDLTDAIGLPAKAAALNGDLAIAFGARGTGGENAARAHYEPGKRVMNLTKMMGAGSLAHEWAHALDHAIGKAGGDEANGISSSNYKVKLRPELESAAKNVRDTIASKIVVRAREELLEEKKSDSAKKALEEHFRDLETGLKGWSYRPAKPLTAEQQSQWDAAKGKILAGDVGKSEFISSSSGGRMSGRDSFGPLEELNSLYKKATGRSFHTADQNSKGKAVYWAIQRHVSANERVAGAKSGESDTGRVKSDFYNEAIKLDRTRAGDYYTEPHEMFARAFEAYVADKLHEKGIRSDYLVSRAKTDNKTYAALGMKPFPEGEERATINAAFDKFFAELKHQDRADDKGSHVQLFSTGFDESKHPRGQPENAGEFGPGGSATRDVLPPDAAKAKPENPGTPAKGKKLARPASRRGGSPVGPRDSESAMAAKKALAVGDVVSAKELGGGTNYTSLVKMADGTKGVFKPAVGEKEDLRSTINGGTYYRREVACSLVADVLGFNDLVPATVEKSVELGGVPQVGSVQHFADGANVAAEADEPYDGSEDLARGAVFDYLVGHMDRHYGNWMLQGGKMVLIDNGLSFPHSENKLESVYCAKGNMRLLKQCYEDDLELPDLSSWEGKWGKVEASLKQSGIEPDAIQLARGRFAALTAGSKKAKAEGKPFKIDDLPGLGVETVAHLFGANLMAMMKAEAEGAK